MVSEGKTPQETRQEGGQSSNATNSGNSSRWENGKLLTTGAEDLRSIVLEEAQYLEKLSRRIEALVESQAKLSSRIELYIRALGIFPSMGRGCAGGFGIFIGATLIASLFVYVLTQWEAVPVIGEFVKRVLEYIQNTP